MNIIWLILGIVYLVLTGFYSYLAHKSRRKVALKNLQIKKSTAEPFMPKNATLEVKVTIDSEGVHRDVRSAGSGPIIDYSNYLADSVQQHLNDSIFPSIKEYLDETSRINTRGFVVAGVLSLIAAIIAFLIAFLVL